MTITTRKVALSGLAILGVAALLAGCASAPKGGGSSGAAGADFLPCMVSDSGGFDDKSFNQLGYEGLIQASDELGIKPVTVQSETETDFAPNISNLVDQNCNLIVTVGFLLAQATAEAAVANPNVNFAIIDDLADIDGDGKTDSSNVKPILFNTAQAAFLAGYSAASYSKTGVVGTFGGIPIPPVTIFMDGFVDGVKYYNEKNGKSVQTLGWDVATQNGVFTGGFAQGVEAKTAAQGLIDQNADVILPVGGAIFISAGEAIRDSGKDIAMIGVDADLYETYPNFKDLYLTSVLKGMKVGVYTVTKDAAAGKFNGSPYVGTLENEGVGIAPFHDLESKVSPGLAAQLEEIKAGIIDGSITVESPSSPK
ncbi:BMP family lipoprotein [Luethyella okanaganae]|uniref:BMP family protein n=1 Tax=Luethyella okanaganae TaxID=69372 RepID=A0ABW1VAJ5_9MICO